MIRGPHWRDSIGRMMRAWLRKRIPVTDAELLRLEIGQLFHGGHIVVINRAENWVEVE